MYLMSTSIVSNSFPRDTQFSMSPYYLVFLWFTNSSPVSNSFPHKTHFSFLFWDTLGICAYLPKGCFHFVYAQFKRSQCLHFFLDMLIQLPIGFKIIITDKTREASLFMGPAPVQVLLIIKCNLSPHSTH